MKKYLQTILKQLNNKTKERSSFMNSILTNLIKSLLFNMVLFFLRKYGIFTVYPKSPIWVDISKRIGMEIIKTIVRHVTQNLIQNYISTKIEDTKDTKGTEKEKKNE